jgi:hypothetical protein
MKIKFLKPYQIHSGVKLLLASLLLVGGNFIGAALCLLFPAFNINMGILATGGGDPEAKEKELLDKIESKIAKAVKASLEGKIDEDQLNKALTKINKEIAALSNEAIAEIKKRVDEMTINGEALVKQLKEAEEALRAQGIELKKLKESGEQTSEEKRVTFRQALKDAIMDKKDKVLKERNDEYGKRFSMKDYFVEDGNKQTPQFTIKVAVDMLESSIVQNNVATIRLTELDAQRVSIPLTIYPHVMSVFNSKTISRPNMALLVVYSYEDGAATKTEGAASSKSSFLLKTVSFAAFYIATYFTLSDETLDDLDEVLDEISIVAPSKILDKIDTYILGSAGDDATAIAGILTANKNTAYATQFGAGTIDAAYIVDVIADAKLQCETNKYRPNVVYLNPTDVASLAAKKNTFEDSKTDKRVVYDAIGNPVAVCGLRVIISTAITTNTCIVIDIAQPWIGKRKDMTMEIGYNGTDLTEGQKTVVIKTRVAFGVRDKAGVIYVSDIATAANTLTKVG